jgi:hypothetical protein
MPIDDDWIRKLWPWLGGAAVGALLPESHYYDDKRKSRAEREDPDGCRELCATVSEILDRWEPPGFEYEDEYTEDLFDFLDEEWRRHPDRNASQDDPRPPGHPDRRPARPGAQNRTEED